MAEKTEYLNLRITPEFKEALRKAAEMEHRSIANMIEVLILNHCQKAGVSIESVSYLRKQLQEKKTRK
ncbi:MAG: DUF1778 domain-containing protein [Deltaproteobacteria bacterium]|nr:DUF1778 domain-containing protein [Deltaproteobacteria bacterium]